MPELLEFEEPIGDLLKEIEALSMLPETEQRRGDIARLNDRITSIRAEIYRGLTPWQRVLVARHPSRPTTLDYIARLFTDFVEIHGDRRYADDHAIVCGIAGYHGQEIVVVGHQKGSDTKQKIYRNFGYARPEGYRKAMLKMKMAEKYRLPLICFIDTPGAYPGVGAEERGQAHVIAESMFLMSQLKTPVICIVIGEGGSGGALGIGVGDRVAMLENSYYSVISPEGCAGILWKSHEFAPKAAEALRFTAKDLSKFGIVDNVIAEPLGGAHRDHHQMATRMRSYLSATLNELDCQPLDSLLDDRYQKFRRMGVFLEEPVA